MSVTDANPTALLAAGKLTEALATANAAVKADPTKFAPRILLAELLLLSGNIERADVILDGASAIDPSAMMVVSEFRQLLRAETARRQLYRDGRVPEFLGEPEASDRAALAALVALRAGEADEAAEQAAQAEELRPRTPGTYNGTAFDDFRDGDDLHPGHLEVLTTTGKYYWIPVSRIESLEFHAPQRARDLAWRRCSMSVSDGPEGDVYVPAIYYADGESDDAHRLGQATDWSDETAGPVRGQGQRTFLISEEAVGIMEIGQITFTRA